MKSIAMFYKKGPKFLTFMITLMALLSLVSGCYLSYTLFLYKEFSLLKTLAIAFIFVSLLVNLIIYLISVKAVLKRKYGKTFIIIFILLLIIIGQIYIGKFYIDKIYGNIRAISESYATYKTDIAVLTKSDIKSENDLNEVTIGVINDGDQDQINNTNEVILELSLENNNKLKEYTEYVSMIKDLLDKKIDAAILPGGYQSIFSSNESLGNIEDDLRTIYSKNFRVKSEKTNVATIDKPFTILIMGIDGLGTDVEKATSINGDALMMITFNPVTLNTTIMSIPRDSYVPITCLANNRKNKITHAGIGGEKCMINTIENFTGINIDYYVKINFSGVVKLVDDLGGIKVDVPLKFCEQDSRRRRGSNQICLKPGKQLLNGEQALALSRHRKTIDDFRRGYNQQLVVAGMINKAKTIRNINTITNMLNTVSKSMKTNMSANQMISLFNLFQKSTGNEPFSSQRLYLSGVGKMIYEPSMRLNLYNYVLYKGSVEDSVNAMKVNLGLKKPTIIKTFSFDASKPYEVKEIGRGHYTTTGSIDDIKLLPSLVGDSKEFITLWCKQNNITPTFTYVTTTIKTMDNKAISQSKKVGTDLSSVKSITFQIGKYKENTPITTPTEPDKEETIPTLDEEA